MRLFADSDRLDWVQWYPVPDGTEWLPIESVYRASAWDGEAYLPAAERPLLGEQGLGRKRQPPPGLGGRAKCYLGDPSWWTSGVPLSALDAVPARPECCSAAPDAVSTAAGVQVYTGYSLDPRVTGSGGRGRQRAAAAMSTPVIRQALAPGQQRAAAAMSTPVIRQALAAGRQRAASAMYSGRVVRRYAIASGRQRSLSYPLGIVRQALASGRQRGLSYLVTLREALALGRQVGRAYLLDPRVSGTGGVVRQVGQGYTLDWRLTGAGARGVERGAAEYGIEDTMPITYTATVSGPSSTVPGMPLTVSGGGIGVRPAVADGSGLDAVGLATVGAAPGGSEVVQCDGLLTLADWSLVTGTPSLAPRGLYFLSPDVPGTLATGVPLVAGQVVQYVGRAVGPQTLWLEISEPILL